MGRKVGGGRHGLLGIGGLDGLIIPHGWGMDGGQWRGRARGCEDGADIAYSECEWVSEWIWLVL